MSADVDELLFKAKWEGKGMATRQRLINKLQGIFIALHFGKYYAGSRFGKKYI